MNEVLVYAKYNKTTNKAVYAELDKMSNQEREKDRGSFCGSLSGLLRHIAGGGLFLLSSLKEPLAGNEAVQEAFSNLPPLPPKGELSPEQWKEFGKTLEAIDDAYIAVAEALSNDELQMLITTDWYGGDPAEIPLWLPLRHLSNHSMHHRGQMSQIFDSLKIDLDIINRGNFREFFL